MATDTAPPALNAHDFLALDALLSEEEQMIRDTVRAFVRERLLPNVAEWFEQGILPREIAPELGKLGLLGMHLEG
jgi:glutaryl-CoA dehydrogenase